MLEISRALRDEMIAQCRSRYPKEACGLLAGPSDGAWRVAAVYPMTNVEDSPIGYSMDPLEQLHTEKRMRAGRQRLIGIYHSHTASAAYPSPVDVSRAISPDVSYVLVSLKDQANPAVRSYRIDGVTITDEPVVIVEASGCARMTKVDVRDMMCAQALALVAQAAQRLAPGQALTVEFNSPDVARDLDAWIRDRHYTMVEQAPTTVTFHR